jgi:hypothetical protein
VVNDEQLKAARESGPSSPPRWFNEPATPPQVKYVTSLIETRQVPERWLLRIQSLAEAGLTKGKAGQIIEALKPLPLKPGQDDRNKNTPRVNDIPPGRYAVQTGDENDIMFYRVIEATNKETGNKYHIIKVLGGPQEYLITGARALSAAKMIVRAGIGNSAALYGHKIGRCSICHTRITNRVSRELGIGPVCGGRVFPDWDTRVTSARQRLLAMGLDPDESIDA